MRSIRRGSDKARPILRRGRQRCAGGHGVLALLVVGLGWNLSLSMVLAAETAIFDNSDLIGRAPRPRCGSAPCRQLPLQAGQVSRGES
jgi:hypothetical protein